MRLVGIEREHGTVVVTLEGVLDGTSAEPLRLLLGDLVDGQGNQSVAVNLAGVKQVAPSVLGLLATMSDRAMAHGGQLVLHEPAPVVVEELGRAGLRRPLTAVR